MSKKLLNLLLVLASLGGYLEWGQGNSMFLLQAEIELFSRGLADPLSVLHPFTLLPVFGQLALLATLFQEKPGKALTWFGLLGLGLLLGFMFLIGVLGRNPRILGSTLPFLAVAAVTVRQHVREGRAPSV